MSPSKILRRERTRGISPYVNARDYLRPHLRRLLLEPLEKRRLLNAFSGMAGNLQSEVGSLQSSLDGAIGTLKSIPFVGTQLGTLDQVQNFIDGSGTKIQNALNNFNQFTGNIQNDLQSALYQAFGAPGLNILGAGNGSLGDSPTGSASDIHVSNVQADSNGIVTQATVEMRLAESATLVSAPLTFNLGLPALPFKITAAGGFSVQIYFDYEFAFTYNSASSPVIALNSSDTLHDFSSGMPAHQMILGVSASLSGNASLMAYVGILYGELTPAGTNSLSAQIAVDNLNLQGTPTVSLVGGGASSAQINLNASLGLGSGGASGEFPSISTTISMNWSDLTNPGSLTFTFGKVSLDLGSFISDLVDPVIQDIQQYTEPLQGAINFLNTPIPGIDKIPGLGDFTLNSILQTVAGYAGYGAVATFFTDVETIATYVDQLGDGLNGVSLSFPDISLKGSAIADAAAALDPSTLLSNLTADLSSLDFDDLTSSAQGLIDGFAGGLANTIAGLVGSDSDAGKLLTALAQSATNPQGASATLSFPLFSDPSSIIGLLFGQDVDLVEFSANVNVTIPTEAFSALNDAFSSVSYLGGGLGFQSSLSINGALTVGYDTYGLRELLRNIEMGDNSDDAQAIAEGFYIQAPTASTTASQLNISGNFDLVAEAGVSFFGVASAYLGFSGGIGGSVGIKVDNADPPPGDGSGKVRYSEIQTELQDGQDVFDVSANSNVTASLTVFVSASLGPLHFKQTLITLASDTLWQASDASNSEVASATPAPTVDGMDPQIGPTAGGTTITIHGTNLENATQVVFGADGLSGGPYANSAYGTIVPGSDGPFSLEVTAPVDSSAFFEFASILVITPSGQAGTSPIFLYLPPPTITSVSPQTGPGGGNEIVEIQGTNLEGVSAVNFGTYPAVVDSDPQYADLDSNYVLYVISPQGSGTVDVNLTTPGGTTMNPTGQSPDPTAFTFVPPPNIEYITGPPYSGEAAGPPVGALAGNQSVTLTGTNLENYSAVYFGGVEVPFTVRYGMYSLNNISVNAAGTQMTIYDNPAQTSPGPVNVTVTTPGGTSNPDGTYLVEVHGIYLPDPDQSQFTYFAVPAVASVSPASGPVDSVAPIFGGQVETYIVGTDLGPAADASVSFGQNTGTIVSDVQLIPSQDPRLWQITADVPAGAAAGIVDVTVTTPGGTSAISRPADAYTYVPPPTVSDVTGLSGLPASGPLSGNTQIEISGTNLAGVEGVVFIMGSTLLAASGAFDAVNSATGNLVVFATSPSSTSSGPFSVEVLTVGGFSAASAAPTDQFTYVPGPSPSGMTPSFGPFEGGNTVTITGSNLGSASLGGTMVDFGLGNPGLVMPDSNPSQLVVTAPAELSGPFGPMGSVTVYVITPDGTTAVGQYNYQIVPPIITSLVPSSGPATYQTPVTITGQNLLDATVLFGGVAGWVQDDSYNEVTATNPTPTSPPNTPGDTVLVTVTTPDGLGSQSVVTSDSLNFTYTTGVAVTGVNPSSGPVGGGTPVTISGVGFSGATSVTFDGYGAQILSISPTAIAVNSPYLGPGTVDVQVTSPLGTSAISQPADEFTYAYPSPTVTGVSPASALTSGGGTATITGTNLESDGTSAVDFGSVVIPFSGITFHSDTSISVTIPASPGGATGAVDVRVQTLGGTSAVNPYDQFTYGAAPSISLLYYSIGPAYNSGALNQEIFGANLSDVFEVIYGSPIPNFETVFPVEGTSGTFIGVPFPNMPPRTVDVQLVANIGGQDVDSAIVPADQFTFTQAPLIETFGGNSSEGPVAGGTSFTITGFNFTTSDDPTGADTVVDIGGNPAVITSISSDQITATTPEGSPGPAAVTVTTSQGSSTAGFVPQFTYFAVPDIMGISPASGGIGGGNIVAITGTGLSNAGGVYFGGNPATSTGYSERSYPLPAAEDADTVSTIFVISPAGSQLGEVNVTAVSPGGTSTADEFTYVPDPAVTGLSVPSGLNPPSGAVEGGTTVTIAGTNLSDATQVDFGQYPGTIVSNTDAQIVAISPDATQGGQYSGLGAVDVTVTTPDGTSAANPPADQFTYTDAPFIGGMSTPSIPGSVVGGPIAGNTTVTINGDGFTGATVVNFGALAAASFMVNSDSSITAVTPAEAAGTVDVSVTTPNGTTDITPEDQFAFAAIPNLSAVSPATGSIASPTQVTVTGTGLAYTSSVSFVDSYGDSFPGTIVSDSDNQLVVTSPDNPTGSFSGVNLSTYDIVVTTPGGTSATGMPDQFTYMPTPAIASVSPASGSVYGGATVTITGTGLAGATSVDIGGNPATIVSNTDYQGTDTLVVLSPESTGDISAYVDVSVTTQYGTFDDAYAYGYYPPPTVTGLSLPSGPLGGGTLLTITGTNLQYATAVDFGPNVTTAVDSYYSNTQIEVTNVPAGSLGTVDVQVLGLGGLSPVTTADEFTYLAAPTVTDISPNAGPSTGATDVTIYGTGLANATSVVFNDGEGDVYPAGIVSNGDGQIVVTSPAAFGTYDIIVSTNGGDSYTSPADQFTYVGAPAVSGVSPDYGFRAGGDTVTISGSDLAYATAVYFGGVAAASFTVNPDDSITATTPAGSDGMVDVSVVTPGGPAPATPANEFNYIQPLPVVAGVSPATGAVGGGDNVTITGTDLDDATAVDFIDSQGDDYVGTIQPGGTATQLIVTTPAGSVGTIDVFVTTAYGGMSLMNPADQFTYLATLTWASGQSGNWTDAEWAGGAYPDNTVDASVGGSGSVVNVTTNQAANALAVQSGVSVTVGPGAVLSVTTDTSVTGSGTTLSVDPSGLFATGGTLTVDMGGSVTGGPVTAAAYQLNDGTVGANLAGPGGVTKDTGGTVTLSGDNTYVGPTVVNNGTLIVDNASALPDGTSLIIAGGGTFEFDPSESGSSVAGQGLAVLAPDTAAVSETSASIVAASAPAGAPLSVSAALTLSSAISAAPAGRMATPLDVATSATTTVFDAVQQVSAVAMPLSTDFRTDAAAQAASASVVNEVPPVAAPTAMSNPTADTLFTSHRSAFDRIAAPANIAQSASAWSWLAAIESSWNSTYQDKKTDSTVAALDAVLAQYGV